MSHGSSARLADVLGALSVATDLAAGVPPETSLRTCTIAVLLGRAVGLAPLELADVYYAALLRHLGCSGFSHEAGRVAGGDDHQLLTTFEGLDKTRRLRTATRAVRTLAKDAPLIARARAVTRALTTPSLGAALSTAQCDQAAALASDIGMSAGVVRALGQIYERFDGAGTPNHLAGGSIDRVARTVHAANLVEILHRKGGRSGVVSELAQRRGTHLDPEMCDAFLDGLATYAEVLESMSVWDAYLGCEPAPHQEIVESRLDDIALAFARYADLKVPLRLGHSTAVARLATNAALAGGLDEGERTTLRRAGLLHDLGVVSVPNGIWEKRGPLNAAEWERVRLHAYYTERILSRVPALAAVARVAGSHHERVDGSGYPRGVATESDARAARLLACADVYEALTADRAHRPAIGPASAESVLRGEVRAGRLCAWSVDCVLASVGRGAPPTKRFPADLTAREVQVLVHVSRGMTNKEISCALQISPRTAQHHVEHIYAKIGVSTRAAAALFAVRNDLVTSDDKRADR